jgi:deoxyribodipyrimidine photo-lyase
MAAIVWFRRDLRVADHTALYHALRDHGQVIPVFIFDDRILRSRECGEPIVAFMLGCLAELQQNLRNAGGDLILRHGRPLQELKALAAETGATALYFNRDYAPDAIERDDRVERSLSRAGLAVRTFKDQVIYEEQEILSASKGDPYTVYTPYRKAWMKRLSADFGPRGPEPLKMPKLMFAALSRARTIELPSVASLIGGADRSVRRAEEMIPPGEAAAHRLLRSFCKHSIASYATTRDLPALTDGTSRLSPHLCHGTLSPRQCLRAALDARAQKSAKGVDTWVGELIWRDFFQQVLFNHPHVAKGSFRPRYDKLRWSYDRKRFAAWCQGRTGYPIVDAAMRQLNRTGWMHNRLRMVVAMFLTKDLQIDWRWGERYFLQHLIDGETAQNNGNWQWCASTGVDAQPWFRIFNPTNQSRKFDPKGEFIRRYVPELRGVSDEAIHDPPPTPGYPRPIVDHASARQRTLAMFKALG